MEVKNQELQEYEKNYLERLETKEKRPQDLQNFIFQMTQEIKKYEKKDYIGLCIVCNKGVERSELIYKNDRVFHPDCFDQHGSEFHAVTNLIREEKRAKIDLVYFKNLKLRMSNQGIRKKHSSAPKKKLVKKPKKKKTSVKKKSSKRKASAKRRKPKQARRKIAKKRSKSKSRKRRR